MQRTTDSSKQDHFPGWRASIFPSQSESLCVPLQPCLAACLTRHALGCASRGCCCCSSGPALAAPSAGAHPGCACTGSPTRLQCSCWACTVCCCLSPSIGFLPLVVTLGCRSSWLPHCLPLHVVCSHALPPNSLNQSVRSFLSSSRSSPERISLGQ